MITKIPYNQSLGQSFEHSQQFAALAYNLNLAISI